MKNQTHGKMCVCVCINSIILNRELGIRWTNAQGHKIDISRVNAEATGF